MKMKILVPVDGSPNSMDALKAASDFVKIKGADILVISVVPTMSDGMADLEISPARRERHMNSMAAVADSAVKQACSLLDSEGVASSCTKTILTSVSIPDAIIDFAVSEKIDLIVMGSRGLSASSTFKIGSVAIHVVKQSPCSVYLVKKPDYGV
jgi:nucleotide-binding universal stress UspA family protein